MLCDDMSIFQFLKYCLLFNLIYAYSQKIGLYIYREKHIVFETMIYEFFFFAVKIFICVC
jgi:hypothetical protein